MRFDLAEIWRRTRKPRRTAVTLRKIEAPGTFASNFYAAAYRPIVALWEAALPDILAVYERSLAEMTQDAPANARARIGQVEREANSILLSVRAVIEPWARRIEAWQRRKWRAAVFSPQPAWTCRPSLVLPMPA